MPSDLVRLPSRCLLGAVLAVATVAALHVADGATIAALGFKPLLLPITLGAFFGGLGGGVVALLVSAVAGAVGLPDAAWERRGAVDLGTILLGGGFVVGLLHQARRTSRLAAAREERFTIITATAMDGIVTLDERYRVTSFNEAAERMFGVAARDILGQPLDRLLPEGFAPEHERLIADFGRSGVTRRQLVGSAIVGRRATGQPFPIDLSISQAMVDGRKVYTGILRDVTERVRADKALRETASQLRLFIDNAPAAIAMFDRDMRYLFASRRWLTDYRIAWPDVAGRSHYEVFPEIPDSWREIHRRCLEGAVEMCEEDCFPRADGTVDWVAWEVRPWFDADGRVGGIMIMSENVTARRLAAEALREGEERWRMLAEALPEAMFVHENDRIAYVNARGLELWRARSADEIVGRSALELIHPESRPVVEALIADHSTPDKFVPLWEARIVALDGTVVPIETTARVRMVDGVQVAQVLVRDISERKEAEAQVRRLNEELEARVQARTAELEAANRELEAFSYTVSHDLRAPLRTMDGFAEMVVEDFASLLPDEGVRRLHVIRERAQRMGALIDALLAFARLGREPLHVAAVDMRGLVDESLAEQLPSCGDRTIAVEVDDLPPCRGDRGLLKQVWANLIGNALKYTRIRASAHVRIGCEVRADGSLAYLVRDDGTGFDMAHAGKLFGVFQRLHRSDEFEGTGVGLATVRRIVERHGGRVWCEAAPGAGAAFFFTLDAGPTEDA